MEVYTNKNSIQSRKSQREERETKGERERRRMAAEEEEAARARQRLEDMGIDVNAVNEIKLKEKNTCSADEKNAVPRLAALRLGEGGVSGELVELAAAVAAAAEEDFGTLVDDASATSAEGDRSKAFGECMSRVRCGLDAATLAGERFLLLFVRPVFAAFRRFS